MTVNNKPLRYLLTGLFSLGAIAMIGILSFSGMLYLTNNVIASIVSCILAVLIEGEIYKQSILSGVDKLFHFGSYISRNNYCNKLKELANSEENQKRCQLLKDYYELVKRREEFQHAKNLNDEQEKDLAKTETSIAEMEELFIRYMNNEADTNNPTVKTLVEGLFTSEDEKATAVKNIQANIKKERFLLWCSMPITVIGGGMALFVTVSQLTAAFLTFGIAITPVLMCTFIWPIAALAAIGFMIMIYKTFVDIIHHKAFQKLWNNFKTTFIEEKNLSTKILYIVAFAFVTLLAILATIATAGTWWTAAQAGIAILPFLATVSNTIKTVICSVGMSLLGTALLFFEYVNSLESLKTVTAKMSRAHVPDNELENLEKMPQIKKIFTIIKYNIQHSFQNWAKNPWGVLVNPFYWINKLIEVPFRFFLFIGHALSIGVTSDRLGNIPAALLATICSTQETMSEIHFFVEEDEHHHHHEEKCAGDTHHEHPHKPEPINDSHHDHHHSDLPGYFLNVVLFPTKLCSAIWNSIFGNKTFTQYFKQEFGIGKNAKIKAHQTSAQWQHYQIDQKLGQEIQRFQGHDASDTIAADKETVFKKVRAEVQNCSPTLSTSTSPLEKILTKKDVQILQQYRNEFFATPTTKSEQALNEIREEFSSISLIPQV